MGTNIVTTDVFTVYDAGNEEEARQFLSNSAATLAEEIMVGYESMALETEEAITAAGIENLNNGRDLMTVSAIISILVILLGLVIVFLTARSITKTVQAVVHYM